MGRDSAQRREWLDARAEQAGEYLSSLPDRAALLARVTELTAGSVTVRGFAAAGEYVFFLRQDGGGGVPVLAARGRESLRAAGSAGEGGHEGWDGRVLLDPARLAVGEGHCSLDWYAPSPDGRRVACGLSQSGSELSVLRVLDVERGELEETAIPGAQLGAVA